MATTVGGIGLALAVGGYLALRSQTSNVWRDVSLIAQLGGMARVINSLNAAKDFTSADLFERCVDAHPNLEALCFVDAQVAYTWRQFDQEVNRVSNWGLSVGIKKGDVAALMMENSPDFLFFLFGLLKIGAVVSLINTSLVGFPLRYSFSVCKAKWFFVGSEHLSEVSKVIPEDPDLAAPTNKWYSVGQQTETGFIQISDLIRKQPTTRPPKSIRKGSSMNDTAVYIYTSGTTGPPKPSIITHLRIAGAGQAFKTICGMTTQDRIYSPLPLYHSSALFIGFGACLMGGCTFVFRKRFSSSSFFKDCTQHNCTLVQYIGELCRYLVNTEPSPYDRAHRVRAAVGNGLRPEVWKEFQGRFGIPQIYEFYASTEGNASLINMFNKEGAVGYVSPLMRKFLPVKIVKFDVQNEVPIRDQRGFCIECAPDEAGELIGKIVPGDPTREFKGYTDKKATEKKILRDVFQKGDLWFRTGDLLRWDKEGNVFFVDRIGDTFRWKGENVATSEVAQVISQVKGVEEVNVYGVQIPHKDGRAGMASLVTNAEFSLEDLYHHCNLNLPKFAFPVFVRLTERMEITGTFKHRKVEFVKEGFDITKIKEPIYFRDDGLGKFVKLDEELYQKLLNNQVARL